MAIILHLDMDAFFASVEARDDPSLRGKPLIIGSLPTERGVVSTCSYEARVYGVHSGMSIKDAYRLCPNGIYMHGNYAKYHQASEIMHQILLEYSDKAEFVASDEGYLDLTNSAHLFGSPEEIGREIKRRVSEALNLTCSVGIGYNMISAKLASEENKPDGFFIVPDEAFFMDYFKDRSVGILNGIGKKFTRTLETYQIKTIADALAWSKDELYRYFGQSGLYLYECVRGIDNREVNGDYGQNKSVSRDVTFQKDLTSFEEMDSALRLISREIATYLQKHGLYARTVTLRLRYNDLQSQTRAESLEAGTDDASVIFRCVSEALHRDGFLRPVRLLGINASRFEQSQTVQLSLMDNEDTARKEKKEKLNRSLLSMFDKFGKDAVQTGAEMESEKLLKDKF